ncbi:EamA family transporter [Candidatus Poribacteria bacterium]|nr:EamA family transporter [Candidatus Poribacteria bacterium]
MKFETKATIALACSALLWSTGGLFIKLVDWNSVSIAGSRSFIASFVLLVHLKKPKPDFSRPQIAAAFSSACAMIFYVLANKMTTAANTILLQYTAPVYVAILAWIILKEKPTFDNWIALFIIMSGMVLFFSEKLSTGNMYGNIIAVFSGLALAFFTVFMRMQKGKSSYESFYLAHIITFLISIPFIIRSSFPDTSGWLGIFALGIFQTGFASLLFAYGIKYIPALKAVFIMTLEPILNPLWVFIFTGEAPGIYAIIGGIIIISAVLFTTAYSSQRKRIIQKKKGGAYETGRKSSTT